ncbi:MAG: hypothetical protein ACJ74Y_19045 [Bryobacteraceae bacterium]
MTVAELISILQKLDPKALVVAPFSPNPSDINVEEVGGAFTRKTTPYDNGIELARMYDSRAEYKAPSNPSRVSKEEIEAIRLADTDAPV